MRNDDIAKEHELDAENHRKNIQNQNLIVPEHAC